MLILDLVSYSIALFSISSVPLMYSVCAIISRHNSYVYSITYQLLPKISDPLLNFVLLSQGTSFSYTLGSNFRISLVSPVICNLNLGDLQRRAVDLLLQTMVFCVAYLLKMNLSPRSTHTADPAAAHVPGEAVNHSSGTWAPVIYVYIWMECLAPGQSLTHPWLLQ